MNKLLIVCIAVALALKLMGSFIGAIYIVWFLMLVLALVGIIEDNKTSWVLSTILLLLIMHPLIQDVSDTKFSIGIIVSVVLAIVYINVSHWLQFIRNQEEEDNHDSLFSFNSEEISYLIKNNNPTLLNTEELTELSYYEKEKETGKMDHSTARGITMFCAVCVSIYIYYNGVSLSLLGPLTMIVALCVFTYLVQIYSSSSSNVYNLMYMQLMQNAKERASYLVEKKR
ncbi:hypothetical protein [Telluribacter humicola]|uniref:hypothetical protein n=1 Tax=Telluribacter humicola TaxID=1720261 RepID=UPI001A966084|nr:hypothetical protein [Telluribacter humicola]